MTTEQAVTEVDVKKGNNEPTETGTQSMGTLDDTHNALWRA